MSLENNRIKWFGHLKRMQEERLPKRMLINCTQKHSHIISIKYVFNIRLLSKQLVIYNLKN